jgi:hypothetical protein
MNIPFQISQRLEFGLSPDTQQAILHGDCGDFVQPHPGGQQTSGALGVTLLLSTEAAQRLLIDLPELKRVLEQAIEGHTKPHSVQ